MCPLKYFVTEVVWGCIFHCTDATDHRNRTVKGIILGFLLYTLLFVTLTRQATLLYRVQYGIELSINSTV